MTRSELKRIINNLDKLSGFFSVLFQKKDGSMRRMTCKMKVHKYHVNKPAKPSTTSHIPKYITTFDVHKRDYRNINIETVVELTMNGKTFVIGD